MKLPTKPLKKNVKQYDVKLMQRALGKLKFKVFEEEHQAGKFGESTVAAVTAFQKQYNLVMTGELDEPTLVKLAEAMAEREANKPVPPPVRLLKVEQLDELPRIRYPLRHNMKKNAVVSLQQTLAFLQIDVDAREAEEQRFGKSTMEAVKKFQESQGLKATGEVDRETALKLNAILTGENPEEPQPALFRLRGSVRDELWNGIPDVKVQVFEQSMREGKMLAEVTTLGNGFFDLKYEPPRIKEAAQPVVVKMFNKEGQLLKTETIGKPGRVAWVNYTEGGASYQGESEMETLTKKLKPELGQIRLDQLEESEIHQDITYLSGRTGETKETIMRLALSHRISARSGLPAEICFGFVRQNMPGSLPGSLLDSTFQWQLVDRIVENALYDIVHLEPTLQRQAMESAVKDNYVPRQMLTVIDKTLTQLGELRTDFTLDKPLTATTTLRMLLQLTPLADSSYARFVELYGKHQGPTVDLWGALLQEPGVFPESVVNDVRLTLNTATIASNHIPTIQSLKAVVKDAKELAKWGQQQWAEHIQANVNQGKEAYPSNIDGTSIEQKVLSFAASLKSKAEEMFPTIAFIASATGVAGTNSLKTSFNLQNLLDDQPDFDLRTTPIDQFVSEKGASLPLEQEDVTELKKIQRVFKMAPTVDAGVALLKNQWHSSAHVYFQGKSRFTEKFAEEGFTKLEGEKVYNLAARNYATLLSKASELRSAFQQLTPQAVGAWSVTTTTDQKSFVGQFPSLEALFGALDYCACSECRSVYSPAAYMVDILRFLREKDAVAYKRTAVDVLFSRRPDIAETELSCTNTNTPVPYIDLVNELLETATAPLSSFTPFPIALSFASTLDQRTISAALRDAFSPKLSSKAAIEIQELGERWIVTEPAYRYTIKRKDSQLIVTSRGRQTSGTKDELAANPEYVHQPAYDKLKTRVYPFHLPFHLPLEETRSYLLHLGVQRSQLAEALLPHRELATNLRDLQSAKEALGLGPVQAAIITGSKVAVDGLDLSTVHPNEYWGFALPNVVISDPSDPDTTLSGPWYRLLSRIDLLLKQAGWTEGTESGKGFVKLLELLDMRYVNPFLTGSQTDRLLTIVSADPKDLNACELNKLVLWANAPTEAERDTMLVDAFGRMHRFLRLSLATGLSFRELDRIVFQLSPNNISDEFLVKLAHVQRIRQHWDASLETVLSWWGPIETFVYAEIDGVPPVQPMYDRLFRNKALSNPLDEAFELNAERSELLRPHAPSTPNPLRAHSKVLTAALGITEAEVGQFLQRLILPDEMNLQALSDLFRNVTLAKTMKLTIQDYLTLRELMPENPFTANADTALTIAYMEKIESIRTSDLTIQELYELLRHKQASSTAVAPSEPEVAAALNDIRTELSKIAEEHALVADSNGEKTRKKLQQLGWSSSLIDSLFSMIHDTAVYEESLSSLSPDIRLTNDTGVYDAPLAAMPIDFKPPVALGQRLQYDATRRVLQVTGALTIEEYALLTSASADAAYRAAVVALFAAPSKVKGHIAYDAATRKLRFTGVMTLARRNALLELANDLYFSTGGGEWETAATDSSAMDPQGLALPPDHDPIPVDIVQYRSAIERLYQAPRTFLQWNMRSFQIPETSAFLSAMPESVNIPDALRSRLFYDPQAKRIRLKGTLSAAERLQIPRPTGETEWNAAVHQLELWTNGPAYFETSVFLEALPGEVSVPAAYRMKLGYDLDNKRITYLGEITDADRQSLSALSSDGSYQAAIAELYSKASSSQVASETFLSSADIAAMFNTSISPAQRCSLLLEKLLPHLRRKLGEQAVKQKVSELLTVDAKTAGAILTQLFPSSDADRSMIEDFLDPSFVGSNPNVTMSSVSSQAAYRSYMLLHKASVLVKKWRMKPELISAVSKSALAAGWLSLSKLPVDESMVDASVDEWLKLKHLIDARERWGLSDENLAGLLQAALEGNTTEGADAERNDAKRRFVIQLSAATQLTLTELEEWLGHVSDHTASGILEASFPKDYFDPYLMLRLELAARMTRRLGVSCSTAKQWVKASPDQADAEGVKQAVKAKYEWSQWLTIAKSLRDPLREKQRDALVGHLLANPKQTSSNRPVWSSKSGLYAYFLLDVEMSAIQMTTRLKQATSSVQLFVQRCLMNLETAEVVLKATDDWNQWEWMKNYRVWEANRKVFLYPENWTEPELRDDKSPFFKELEEFIAQHEITEDHVEQGLLNYLEKLDEVSRLEICSMYHETEGTTDIVHVLARTKANPATYYYRRYIDDTYWTGWEKIEMDIDSDHATLAVHNRKLHILWPVFTEQMPRRQIQPPAKISESPKLAPEAPKYWEIQLAWTVYKGGAWTPKKISKRKLIHPWQRPKTAYHFKPRLRSGYLWIDVFLSTSPEFNNQLFYYPEEDKWAGRAYAAFDESLRPWHSSSFVFNGDVIDIYLKDLRGSLTNEVRLKYGEEGRETKELGYYERMSRQVLPAGMHFRNTKLVNNTQNMNYNSLNVITNQYQRVDPDGGRLLDSANAPFSLVIAQQDAQLDTENRPFFYQDLERSFFVKPAKEYKVGNEFTPVAPANPASYPYRIKYTMYPFYHPYTNLFISELNRFGIKGVLNRKVQVEPNRVGEGNFFQFPYEYSPRSLTKPSDSAMREVVDFDGAYAIYNWELFFHAPLMIACRLSENQRFEEAMRWFHYIFDPTNTENAATPQKYWITKPFYQHTSEEYRNQRIENLLKLVNTADPEYVKQVELWRKNPFNPHLVARLRPVTYQWTVVMKYIDNLIAWADQLFRRDTIESINEATLLYVLASDILGRRPERIPPRNRVEDLSFAELEERLDAFSNAMYELEHSLPPSMLQMGVTGSEQQLPPLETFYFGIPHNDKLLKYWDLVEDRLFKLRHSLNIEGKLRELPLFDPPIDPALLVKAAAAGVDMSSVLSDMSVSLPQYRFPLMLQKAQQYCAEVKSLGAQLLGALEKKDAEALAILRDTHEMKLLQETRGLKTLALKELDESLHSLEKSKEAAQQKVDYYSNLQFMNAWEVTALSLSGASTAMDAAIAAGYILSGGLKLIPKFVAGVSGFGGSPTATAEIGGFGDSAEDLVKTMSAITHSLDKMSSMATTMGSYHRRKEEWDHQLALAENELAQLERQIAGAQIRIEMAAKEIHNHDLQIENAKSVHQFMQSKFTNADLYQWMAGQLSTVYFQSYQLAYDMAKRAEKAFRFEVGLQDSSYIQFGYWDGLKKGLLAGEKLAYDLTRLDVAYSELNTRQLEIAKHVSLAQVAPFSLLKLKETGSCLVELPEWLFDLDYPGHYRRRLKSVSISVPCVAGPYTGVNCTLSLVSSSIRTSASAIGKYARNGINDSRFADQYGLSQAIATSTGQNDSGMFQLNFNDERYLPFEGSGAISLWKIDLPHDCNGIDFATLSDVILHVHYTAVDGGQPLAAAARTALQEIMPQQGMRIFSLKHDFGSEWHRFLHPVQSEVDQELLIDFNPMHLPFFERNKNPKVTELHLIAHCKQGGSYDIQVTPPSQAGATILAVKDNEFGTAHHAKKGYSASGEPAIKGTWSFKIKESAMGNYRSLAESDVSEVFLIVRYHTV